MSHVVSDSTLQLQPVWAAEPEPTSGLVADYNVVRGDQTVYRLVLFRHDIACSLCRDVLAAALYDAGGDALVQVLLLDYWEVRGERVSTAHGFCANLLVARWRPNWLLSSMSMGSVGPLFQPEVIVEQLNTAAAWVRDHPLETPESEGERL